MWHDMFVIQIPVLEKILRTVVVYATLLSNVVQNAVIGNDDSVSGGIIGAATLVAINAAVNRWQIASPQRGGPRHPGPERRRRQRDRRRPDGTVRQLILSLKSEDQSATKGDITHLNTRLDKIDALLALLSAHAAR